MNQDSEKPVDLKSWGYFYETRNLSIKRKKLLTPDSRIFTIGSCFAHELQKAMIRKGMTCSPQYHLLPVDEKTEIFDKIGTREFPAHYDTFVIRQEFEAMLGLWTDREKGYSEVRGGLACEHFGQEVVYQDPFRRRTYAVSMEALKSLSDRVTAFMRAGLEESDIVVITLGQIEAWRHFKTNRYFARRPGSGYGGEKFIAGFLQSSITQNYDNMKALLDALFARYPDKQVILTVSPIPLILTFSDSDAGTATLEGKSVLRGVAGQISREYKNVTYFPSYEMATLMNIPVFLEDGRHIRPDFADRVIALFWKAFA